MKVTFLGTGTSSGVPMIACDCEVCTSDDPKDKRLRCSMLLEFKDGKVIVIDIGPDFRQQMITNRVKSIDAILITHCHRDHTAGLDDIRAFNFHLKREIEVFMDKPTEKEVREQFSYVFAANPYPGLPMVKVVRFNEQKFTAAGYEIIPIKTLHHKMVVWGFRINDFTYVTDANYIGPKEMDKIKGSKIFVINALRKTKHLSHFTLDEALEIIQRINPSHAYLTHLSHQMGRHKDVSRDLPQNVSIAYDGLKLTI